MVAKVKEVQSILSDLGMRAELLTGGGTGTFRFEGSSGTLQGDYLPYISLSFLSNVSKKPFGLILRVFTYPFLSATLGYPFFFVTRAQLIDVHDRRIQ